MARQYSAGILIKGSRRDGNQISALSGAKGKSFIDATVASLDAIKRTSTGGRLLSAIDASGHTVEIYRTWDATGGNYQGGDDPSKSMVEEFDTLYTDGSTELEDVLAVACEDLSGRSRVKKLFGVGKARPRFLTRDAIARLVGISRRELDAMAKGKMPIPPQTDARLKSYLYPFLTPGPGCSCHVVFNHLRDNLSDRHKRYLPMTHTWEHRPPTIALGHELIHAWRVVAGMVLFDYGWEEEAMTVGLPPFSNMEFTENRLRIEYGGLAIRPDYQNIVTKTPLTDGMKLGVDRSNMAWQGDSGALHPQQSLAQAMSGRRRAMGYDQDDESDDGF